MEIDLYEQYPIVLKMLECRNISTERITVDQLIKILRNDRLEKESKLEEKKEKMCKVL